MNEIVKYQNDVAIIKEAILRSQYRAVSVVNKEQLSLYYGIGKYVSENSRDGFWGTGAIEQISIMLQKELPGLRGFSAANIKKMRIFYDEWKPFINRQLIIGDLQNAENLHVANRSPMANDLPEFRQLPTGDLQNVDKELNLNCQPLAGDLEVELLIKNYRI